MNQNGTISIATSKNIQTKKIVAAVVIASVLGALFGFSSSYIILGDRIDGMNTKIDSMNTTFGTQIDKITAPKQWVKIEQFSGTDHSDIPKITIKAEHWRVYWYASTDSEYPFLSIVFNDQNGKTVFDATPQTDDFLAGATASGVSYGTGAGSFSATVYAANLNLWMVYVYAYQ